MHSLFWLVSQSIAVNLFKCFPDSSFVRDKAKKKVHLPPSHQTTHTSSSRNSQPLRLAASSPTCVGWGGGVGADEHRPLKPRTARMEGKTTRWVVSSRMQHQTHAWMARQSRSCRKLVVFHTAGHPASVHHACL